MSFRNVLIATLSLSSLALIGCGGPPELPPLETLIVEKPSAAAAVSNTTAQALCVSDFDVSGLDAFIDQVNNGVEDQIELLKNLQATSPRRKAGQWVWEVTEGQFTLSLAATEAAQTITYAATLSHPAIGDYNFMNGQLDEAAATGGWTFLGLGGNALIDVEYALDSEGYSVSRVNHITQVEAGYSLIGTTFTVGFEGRVNRATASWDTVSYDGSFQLNDQPAACWDYTEESGDFCAAECAL